MTMGGGLWTRLAASVSLLFSVNALGVGGDARVKFDELRLLNGDRIHGEFQSISGENVTFRARWENSASEIPGKFAGYIRFADPRLAERKSASTEDRVRVFLTNGDQVIGRIDGLEKGVLRFIDRGGQTLNIRLPMVDRLVYLRENGTRIVDGFGEESDWTKGSANQGRPQFKAGMMLLQQGNVLHRAYGELPERLHARFSVAGGLDDFYLEVNPVGAPSSSRYSEGVHMGIMPGQLGIHSFSGGRMSTAEARITRKPRGVFTRFDVYIDYPAKRAVIYVDGTRAKEVDIGVFDDRMRRSAGFYLRANSTDILLRDLHVQTWTRGLEQERLRKRQQENDVFLLANADVLTGRLERIEKGTAWVRVRKDKSVGLETSAIQEVLLSGGDRYHPRRTKRDVEAWFGSEGERLTLAVGTIDKTKFVGESETFIGGVSIPRSSLRLMRFNIYSKRRLDDVDYRREWYFAPVPLVDPHKQKRTRQTHDRLFGDPFGDDPFRPRLP